MFLQWSARLLVGIALSSLGTTVPLLAQMRGHSPNRLQLRDQVGQALPTMAKGIQQQAMAAVSNTESDYLDPAFWNAPPFLDGNVPFKWPSDWGVADRRGDTRLKSSRILAKWNPQHDGTGSDHFYLRFDLQRVVTSAADFTSQGHLSDTTYARMRDGGLLSGKTKIKIELGVAYEKPDYTVNYVNWSEQVHLHDLTYDVMVLDINGTPLNILFPGLKYGRFVPTMPLTVPTSALRFPVKGAPEPTPAWNVIHFKLVPPQVTSPDVYGGAGYYRHAKIPATFIPYSFLLDAELSFGAVAPIFLVHGTNAKPDTWDLPGNGHSFNDYFSTFHGVYFNDIALLPNGAVNGNGTMLEGQIADRLASVGAKRCHIVAHSKGGNDSRAMISIHYGKKWNQSLDQPKHFEVLSLYTLDTPHRGTIMADISWSVQNAKGSVVADPNWPGLQTLVNLDYWWLHQSWPFHPDSKACAPTGDALDNNRTEYMKNWNDSHYIDLYKANSTNDEIIPIKFYNTAANADWSIRNLQIDSTENFLEGGGLIYGNSSQYPLNNLATSAYQILYWAKRVDARTSTRPVTVRDKEGNTYTINRLVTELFVPSSNPQANGTWNDSVVAIDSAIYDGSIPFCPASIPSLGGVLLGNHSGIKTRTMASEIVNQIRSDWVIQ